MKTPFTLDAIDAFQNSLKLNKNADTYNYLGWAHLKSGQNKNAVNAFKKSIELQLHWMAYQGLGIAYVNQLLFQDSIDPLLSSLKIKKHWKSYLKLGVSYVNLNNNIQAIQAFENCLEHRQDWQAHQGLGWAYLQESNPDKAIHHFTCSLNLSVKWGSYLGLGESYLKAGKIQDAISSFCRMQELGAPWNEFLAIVKMLINKYSFDVACELVMDLQKKLDEDYFPLLILGSVCMKNGLQDEFNYLNKKNGMKISSEIIDFYHSNECMDKIEYQDFASIDFAMRNLMDANYIHCNDTFDVKDRKSYDRKDIRLAALSCIEIDGIITEFGVYKGESISQIAQYLPMKVIHGFDSFEGFPDQMSHLKNMHVREGGLNTCGILPNVPENVRLHKGWFKDTIPTFLDLYPSSISSFIHIDCVLMSSTFDALTLMEKTIVPGTIILFDEFFNCKNWLQQEYQGFLRFTQRFDVQFKYLLYTDTQVCLKITSKSA